MDLLSSVRSVSSVVNPALAVFVLALAGRTEAAPAGTLGVVKVPDRDRPDYPWLSDYMIALERFPLYAERGWHAGHAGDPRIGYFGDARSDENGQRTLSNFIFVYAVLAGEETYDAAVSGVDRSVIREHALAAIRYMTRTHVTGDLKCTDGKPWGDHWQSPWWAGKFAAGADLLRDDLTEPEREGVRRVLVHEADRLLARGRVPIGEFGNTRSEENAWDTEVLAWAYRWCPGNPNRARWLEMLNRLAFNTLSVREDLEDARVVAGRPVREWVEGANIHSDFTIENHGFFHICYMACPQHSFAWDWWAFSSAGEPVPEGVGHHVSEVWERTLRFALWDGRFAYVGGKDWPRYAYGMYFIMPALVRYQEETGDRFARLIERLRFDAFEREQRIHGDGSFFSGRFTHLEMRRWPAEWETDCAANLALCYLAHKRGRKVPAATLDELDAHVSGVQLAKDAGHVAVRGRNRFASLSYKSHGGPVTALFSSRRGEHLLEWNRNLVGEFEAKGARSGHSVLRHAETTFEGGFASAAHLAEGAMEVDSPWRLEVVDENVPSAGIEKRDHPVFTKPNLIESLDGLTDLDSITAAGPAWTVLARNRRGGPSILESRHGRGVFVVVACDAEERYTKGEPAGRLWENLVCHAAGADTLEAARTRRVAYVAGESFAREALEKAGVTFDTFADPGRADFGRYDAVVIDRTAPAALPHYRRLLEYVEGGGRVLKCVVQDRGWRPDAIGPDPGRAFDHHIAVFAPPDDASLLKVELVVTAREGVRVTRRRGLGLKIANDIFNGNRRTFRHAEGELEVQGVGGPARDVRLPGAWLSVDDALALFACGGTDGGWTLHDDPARRAPAGSLCYETLFLPADDAPDAGPVAEGTVVSDTAVLLAAGLDHAGTREAAERRPVERLPSPGPLERRYLVRGRDSRDYMAVANFGRAPVEVRLGDEWEALPPARGAPAARDLPGTTAELFVRRARGR